MYFYRLNGKNHEALKGLDPSHPMSVPLFRERIGSSEISTVFLSLDHSFGDSGGPVLFETMVLGGEHDGHQERYRTYEEAEEGHTRICEMVDRLRIERDEKLKRIGID